MQNENTTDTRRYLGIDAGAETIKMTLCERTPDGGLRPVWHALREHHKEPVETIRQLLAEVDWSTLAGAAATGRLSRLFQLPRIPVKQAQVAGFRQLHPHQQTGTVVSIGSHGFSVLELRDTPEADWGDVSAHVSLQYQLFPNTALTFDSRHIELWQIFPVEVGTSEVVHTAYVRPGLPEAEVDRLAEMAPWICDTVVDGEDFWVAGRTEPGLGTGLVPSVVLGRNEPALQHMHRGFRAALDAGR